jgi:hypothetical protein
LNLFEVLEGIQALSIVMNRFVEVTAPVSQPGEWEQFLVGYDDEGDAITSA